jgi:hydroxyacylglutathione hydrolase
VPILRATHPGWLSNAWLVWDEAGGAAVLVDSGAPLEALFAQIDGGRLAVHAVLTTHRHPDHVAGHAEVVRRTGAAVLASAVEAPHVPRARAVAPDDTLRFGGLAARLVPLPGHTAGHAGFEVEGVGLFTGDALFRGSVGGTVGPAASGLDDQRRSIEAILAYPPETPLHPGHGPSTTVRAELAENAIAGALLGLLPPEATPARALGRPATLLALARDYDGGTKGWVRFEDDGTEAIVPGSAIEILG